MKCSEILGKLPHFAITALPIALPCPVTIFAKYTPVATPGRCHPGRPRASRRHLTLKSLSG
jgi:hypothetical protein